MTQAGLTQVNIKILEKDYQISCPTNERVALLDSAELLNKKCEKYAIPARSSVLTG